MCVYSYLSLFNGFLSFRWNNNEQRNKKKTKKKKYTNNNKHTQENWCKQKMPIEIQKKECYWPPPIVIALRINKKITNNSCTFNLALLCVCLFMCMCILFLFLFGVNFIAIIFLFFKLQTQRHLACLCIHKSKKRCWYETTMWWE